MKVISAKYLNFEGINSESYIGEAITTKDCKMPTGYRGSGKPIVTEEMPAGTKVMFRLRRNGINTQCWLEIEYKAPSDRYGLVELRANHTIDLPLSEAAKKLHIDENTPAYRR